MFQKDSQTIPSTDRKIPRVEAQKRKRRRRRSTTGVGVMSKAKRLSRRELEDLCLRGSINEEEFIKHIKSKFSEDDAEIIIKDMHNRLQALNQPKEEVPELQLKIVRCVSVGRSVLEAISWNSNPMFLVFNSSTEDLKLRWTTLPEYKVGNMRYLPESDPPYKPYSINEDDLPWLQNELRTVPPINYYYPFVSKEVKTFVDTSMAVGSFITNTILLSYEQHKHNSLGYPTFYGVPDSGKTRIGEIIRDIGYRPLMSVKLNAANVYDFIGTENEGDCTIIDDEIQDLDKDPDKREVYRSGYRKSATVRRILEPSSLQRTHRNYNTYCLKILLGYYPPNDYALTSRTIPNIMTPGYPEKDEVEDEDRLRFLHLKNKLLLSRMVHYNDPLPQLTIDLKGRTKEVWKAQLLSSSGTPMYEDIVKLLQDNIKEQEVERKETLDAHLITVVLALSELQNSTSLEYTEIWQTLLYYLEEGEQIEKGVSSFQCTRLDHKVSKWVVGKKLGTVLVSKQSNEWVGNKVINVHKFDKRILESLQVRFKITDEDKFNCIHARFGIGEMVEKADKQWRGVSY